MEETLESLKARIKELEEENWLYKSIIDQLPFGIQIFDRHGLSFSLNTKQQELLGTPSTSTGVGQFNVLTDPFAKATGAASIYQRVYQGQKHEHIFKYNLGLEENQWDTKKEHRYFHEHIFPLQKNGNAPSFVIAVLNDVTQQQNTEQELSTIKQRFELAMHATNDGLWDWDLKTNEVYFSSNWKSMLGYHYDELPNEFSVWEALTHPDDLEPAKNKLQQHFDGKSDRYDVEFRMQHKNGRWVNILSRGNAYFDKDGNAYRMVGTHVDITERKRIKKALEDSEKRWKFAIEGNKDGLWDWNIVNDEVFFSNQWKKMIGYEPHEVQNKLHEWDVRIHPDDKAQAYKDIEKHLNGETDFYTNEHRLLCKDGSYKWILDRGVIIQRDKQNKPTRLIGTHTDISKRKEAEKQLEASEQKFKSIFEILDVGLTITDKDGNIIDCNGASELILGISKAEHLSRNYAGKEWKIVRTDNTPMPPSEFASVRAMSENKAILNVEMGIVKPMGITWISVSALPLGQPSNGVLIAYVDITRLKETEQQLIELNATKDKFYSIIAHDLRSPYHAIMGFSELALSSIAQENLTNTKRYCSMIYQASGQSLALLDNLLEWSRVQNKHIPFSPQILNARNLVNNAHNLFIASAAQKNLCIKVEIDPELELYADQYMFETILRNLLSNAIKYSKPNGTIHLAAKNIGCCAQISVRDEGVGISADNLKKLFKLESSFSTQGTNNEKGTGLGLLLCKEFVDVHQGKIWAESQLTKGTTFSFTMPSSRNAQQA